MLIARVELTSGLAYNPAPPSWRTHFDHVRDAWNHEQGWARPDDPTRARLVQPPAHEMFKAAAAARAGQTKGVVPVRCSPDGWWTRSPPVRVVERALGLGGKYQCRGAGHHERSQVLGRDRS